MVKSLIAARVGIGSLITLVFSLNVSHAAFWQMDSYAERSISESHGVQFFSGDEPALRRFLDQMPQEHSGQGLEIDLPMPDGSMARYQILASSIMEPELAAKFSNIKSYEVRGIDYPGSFGRVDISHKGFRGMIDTPYGRVFIDPDQSQSSRYMARSAGSQARTEGLQCQAYDLKTNQSRVAEFNGASTTGSRIAGSITAYRLAVSTTTEYVTEVGGTLDDAMSEINTAINRVNQIYQRDLGIKLFLVADNDELIDVPPGTAGFTNGDALSMLFENQEWIDSQIGSESYDIGHVFGTGNTGGVASIQSVCRDSDKAQGATGIPNPTTDIFYIDFVAHEIGHQFGGNHTFNGTERSCGGFNRNGATAFEPGSGSTIMAYAGICGDENLQLNSEATFHAGTIEEINAFVTGNGGGASCATILPLSKANSEPVTDAGIDRIIPMGTPFSLTGSATDADSDPLSYQWDQMDAKANGETDKDSIGTDLGNNPLFRSFVPQTSGIRHFPQLVDQIDGTTDIGETLPTTDRVLNFRLTSRDCKSGQATDDVRLTVDSASGPFGVNPLASTSFPGTSTQTITWSVANTINAPISCANVDIDLLTFSADQKTYGITNLEAGTPNDGTEDVTFGDKSSSLARIRVSCSDNIFYDISNANLDITGATAFGTSGNTVALSEAASCGAIDIDGTPPGTDSGGVGGSGGSGGGGVSQPLMLFYVLILLGLGRRGRSVKY